MKPSDHAVRRADLGARPGDDQGGAGRDGGTGRGRHDHDLRDPRDGVRQDRGQHHGVHGRGRDRRDGAAGGILRQSEERAHQEVPQPDPDPLTPDPPTPAVWRDDRGRSRTVQDAPAGGRQLRERHRFRRLRGRDNGLVQAGPLGVREPPREAFVAAVAGRERILVLAGPIVRRTAEPDVEVIVVPPPRPDLGEPRAVRTGDGAEFALDGRVDEDPVHLGEAGRRLQQPRVHRRSSAGDRWTARRG